MSLQFTHRWIQKSKCRVYLSRGVRFAHTLNRSFVRIKLTRKLSNVLNDVDLRPFTAGNVIDLAAPSAEMLIAEGWAERIGEPADMRATADDRGRTTRQRLNDLLANAPRAVKPRK